MSDHQFESLDSWFQLLGELPDVKRRWGERPQFELLCPRKPVADDAVKILVRRDSGQPTGVAKCSEGDNSQVFIEHEAILRSRAALGPELAQAVITPLHYEQTRLGPVLLQPFHRPMSEGRLRSRLDCFRFQRPVLTWLRQVVAHTKRGLDDLQANSLFHQPLLALAADSAMSTEINAACQTALAGLDNAAWQPRSCLMHGDFWSGNLLKNDSRNSRWPFVVIDWAGAQAAGYPFVDLLRMSGSLRVRPSALRREIELHAQIMGCNVADARAYLLSYFGWLGQNLNEFPVENYRRLVRQTYAQIDPLIPSFR